MGSDNQLVVGGSFLVPFIDIDKMITTIAKRACMRYNLGYADQIDDLRQEAWLIAVKKAPCYVPRGQKPTSYLWDWMSYVIDRHAGKARTRTNRYVEVSDEMWEVIGGTAMVEAIEDQETLDEIDPLLVMSGYGYNDTEIAEILHESVKEITRRRLAARKTLSAQA